MSYLIDGHNVIPKIPGLTLEALDDEIQLIEILIQFSRLRRKQIEVYFDKAPLGVPRIKKYGTVTVRFVREGQTADEAIRSRLQNLGRQARNWIVVSSDQAVQSAARSVHARYISAETFAQQLHNIDKYNAGTKPEAELSDEELAKWMDLFTRGKDL